jgi:hypothetical protein
MEGVTLTIADLYRSLPDFSASQDVSKSNTYFTPPPEAAYIV